MSIVYHHPLCPGSRFIRLMIEEYGAETDLVEEKAWERRTGFLALNPAGTTPVLVTDGGLAIPGSGVIAEWLAETFSGQVADRPLFPADSEARVEVRRLTEWFNLKFHAEVSGLLVEEKIYKRFMTAEFGGGPPEPSAIRAAKANIRYHLRYIGYLVRQRNWLAGESLTHADLAAAAHLSVVDYLGDVPWDEDVMAKEWYARIKSRPSFRPLLADRLRGMAPPESYSDLDF